MAVIPVEPVAETSVDAAAEQAKFKAELVATLMTPSGGLWARELLDRPIFAPRPGVTAEDARRMADELDQETAADDPEEASEKQAPTGKQADKQCKAVRVPKRFRGSRPFYRCLGFVNRKGDRCR